MNDQIPPLWVIVDRSSPQCVLYIISDRDPVSGYLPKSSMNDQRTYIFHSLSELSLHLESRGFACPKAGYFLATIEEVIKGESNIVRRVPPVHAPHWDSETSTQAEPSSR